MKVSIPKQHLLFTIAYFVTMLTLLLNQIGALPFPLLLRKMKYPYILFVLILFFMNNRVKRQSKLALFTIGLFLLHTILFGYIFTNPIAAENIDSNASQMMWFLIMVLVTYLYVSQNNLFELFISTSFYVTGLQLLIGLLMYPGDFVNPLWGLKQAFAGGIRYKTTFGFVHAGYLSNAAYLVIVLSIFYYELKRHYTGRQKMIMWVSLLVIDGLAFEMLMAAAERSGIISVAMVVMFYAAFVFFKLRIEKKTLIFFFVLFFIAIVIMAALGVFTYIWANSNRSLNISVNYPVFKELGNLWTGMGFVDNSGFHKEIAAFGVETSSLDLYYVYIFFTTGVVGCIIIGLGVLIMLFSLLLRCKSNLHITTLGLYLSMLFFAFWQCNMVTYRYVSPTILFLIVLFSMSNDFCMGRSIRDAKSTEKEKCVSA